MKIPITYKNVAGFLVLCVCITALGCASSPRNLLSRLWKPSPESEETSLAEAENEEAQESPEKPSAKVAANALAKKDSPASDSAGRVRIASLSDSRPSGKNEKEPPFAATNRNDSLSNGKMSGNPFLQSSRKKSRFSKKETSPKASDLARNEVDSSRRLPLDFEGSRSRSSADRHRQVAKRQRSSDSRSQLERLRAMLEAEEQKTSGNQRKKRGVVSAKMEVSSQEQSKGKSEQKAVRNADYSSSSQKKNEPSIPGENPFEQDNPFDSRAPESTEAISTGAKTEKQTTDEAPVISPRIKGEACKGMILDSDEVPSKFDNPHRRSFPSSSHYQKGDNAIVPVGGEEGGSHENDCCSDKGDCCSDKEHEHGAVHADFTRSHSHTQGAVWASVDNGGAQDRSSEKAPAFLPPEANQWTSLSEKEDVAPAPPLSSTATAQEVVSSSPQNLSAANWNVAAPTIQEEAPVVPWPVLLGFGLGVICLIAWGIKRRASVNW